VRSEGGWGSRGAGPCEGPGEEMRRSGEPFKQVLNDAIRAGLRSMKRRDEAFER
jgi:hypothetical protein